MLDLFSQYPIQDNICSYLTFEEAIPLQTVLKPVILQHLFTVRTKQGIALTFSQINKLTIRVYACLKKHGTISSSLFSAIKKEDIPVIQYLLKEVRRLKTREGIRQIALITAINTGNQEIVKILLTKADLNKVHSNELPLTVVSKKGDCPIIEILLAAGADIDNCNPDQMTALMAAIQGNQLPAVILLLERGANPYFEAHRENALMMAARLGRDQILEWMLDHGFDANFCLSWGNNGEFSGESLLLTAIHNGQYSTVQLLVKKGADINYIPHGSRYSTFDDTIFSDNLEIIDCLISAGISQEEINGGFGLAAEFGKNELLKHLLKYEITPETITHSLQYAIQEGYLETVKYLVGYKADLNYRNDDGQTALEIAKSCRKSAIVDFLESL